MKPITLSLTVDADAVVNLLTHAIEQGTVQFTKVMLEAIQELGVETKAVPVQSVVESPLPQSVEPENQGEALLDGKAVAKLLGVSQRMVWRLKDGGRMPRPIKLGSLVRWKPDEIRQWIEAGCPKAEQRGVPRSRR